MNRGWFAVASMRDGARAILPLSIGAFPFGLAYGVTVVESSMDDFVGWLASFIVVAGAAQLAITDLIDQGAPWFVIIGTALIINARFTMYSGALAPSFSEFPKRWRIPLAHLMTDQATVTSLLYDQREREPRKRFAYYVGAAGSFAMAWWIGTTIGVVIGATIPPELQVGFAAPLMFIALAVPSIRDRAGLVAAAVGFSVTLIARDAPMNTGLLIGAAVGIAFGMAARSRTEATPVVAIADADPEAPVTADLGIVLVVAVGTLAMRASMITLLADVTIPPRAEAGAQPRGAGSTGRPRGPDALPRRTASSDRSAAGTSPGRSRRWWPGAPDRSAGPCSRAWSAYGCSRVSDLAELRSSSVPTGAGHID